MPRTWLLLLVVACGGEPDREPARSDLATDTTEPPSSTPEPVALGYPCEPGVDVCEDGALCCTKCCEPGERAVCTASDVNAQCPLPDLSIDASRIETSVDLQDIPIDEDSCELVEGCVIAPGWRRVLRFGLTTPNFGTDHLAFGEPEDSPELFSFSECHEHFHFDGYAAYSLLDSDGNVAASGHKQAFCLMDFEQLDPEARPQARYDCYTQGISVGWGDTYDSYLDCQWVDITGVPAGTYTLEVEINIDREIPENDYSNNLASVEVVVRDAADEPPVTEACVNLAYGEHRNCGWTVAGTWPCTPGEVFDIGCEGACDGACGGDTVLRLCDGADEACRSADAIGSNDEADCGGSACSWEEGLTCPASGTITALVAGWASTSTSTCTVVTAPGAL